MPCRCSPSGAQRASRIRIWSAGCSTGQEAYSLAMLFAEEPPTWNGWTIDILGTDVSTSAIDRARNGSYSHFEVQRGLGINQTIRWFEEHEGGWRAVEGLRKPVRFQVHNLLEPPPHPGEFDIVLCRNVLLYLNAEKRTLAFERLASAMAAGRLADARRRRNGDWANAQANSDRRRAGSIDWRMRRAKARRG